MVVDNRTRLIACLFFKIMPRLNNRRSAFNFFPLLILLLTVFIIAFGVIRGFSSFRNSITRNDSAQELSVLWGETNYPEILYQTELRLQENPFDEEALFFNGASSFYMAMSMVSMEDKIEYLQRAITSLRLHMLSPGLLYLKETYYLLGKCYVQSGAYYSDLAVEYLLKARQLGYDNSDMDEYLAIAYSRMGQFTKSLEYLTGMAEKTPTASLFLRMGEDAFNMGQYEQSRDFLQRAVDLAKNEPVRLEALLKLGELFFNIKNWPEAQKVLSQYLDIDYNNADVHFMLGEVYFYMGDEGSARQEWHRTERIDPHYREALLRLYN